MKRDMDLVRAILIATRNLPPREVIEDMTIPGYDEATVNEHVALLVEAGLVIAEPSQLCTGRIEPYSVHRLTWAGHDFIDLALNDNVWKKLTDALGNQAMTVSFELMKALLAAIAAKMLNAYLGTS